MLVQAWNFMNINRALPPASPNHGVLKLKSRRSKLNIYISLSLSQPLKYFQRSVMNGNIKTRQTKWSACMIPSFNYCFYWFSGTICIPDSFLCKLTNQDSFISPNQHGNNFPRLHPIFYSKPVGFLLSPQPSLPGHCVFATFYQISITKKHRISPKGGAMKAVKSWWFFANLISDIKKQRW